MSEIKNYGKSIRARLLNVAKQEEVFYQTIPAETFPCFLTMPTN